MWIGSLCEEVKKCFPFFVQKKQKPPFSEEIEPKVKNFIRNIRFVFDDDKVENRWLFEKVTHSYKNSFQAASTYKLSKMTKFLTDGFKVCKPQHQRIFEIWAFEIMVGTGRTIIKEERKKERGQWRWEIYYGLSPSAIFEKNPLALSQIVEAVQENRITEKAGKEILKAWLLNKDLDVKHEIKVLSHIKECHPASKQEVQLAVEDFLENIQVHYLKKRIVKVFHDYYDEKIIYEHSENKISKKLRTIQKIMEKNDVVSLILTGDTSRFLETARKICRHNPYFKRVDEIEKTLHKCLKLKNPFFITMQQMLVGEKDPIDTHFICQPIMKRLNYRTSKRTILEVLDSYIRD